MSTLGDNYRRACIEMLEFVHDNFNTKAPTLRIMDAELRASVITFKRTYTEQIVDALASRTPNADKSNYLQDDGHHGEPV